ncbi:MAG: hypothetical protein JWM59_2559 [Verrucomicrobiales bacterium]|nr:hypothetical protein [Verrucomicrobiales bacterium]
MGKLPPELQDSAVSGLVERWGAQDAESASRWLSGRPEGPARDAGVKALIGSISDTNPAEAWKWALSVSDSKARGDALKAVFRQWQGKDGSAAMAALQALDPPLPGLSLR